MIRVMALVFSLSVLAEVSPLDYPSQSREMAVDIGGLPVTCLTARRAYPFSVDVIQARVMELKLEGQARLGEAYQIMAKLSVKSQSRADRKALDKEFYETLDLARGATRETGRLLDLLECVLKPRLPKEIPN